MKVTISIERDKKGFQVLALTLTSGEESEKYDIRTYPGSITKALTGASWWGDRGLFSTGEDLVGFRFASGSSLYVAQVDVDFSTTPLPPSPSADCSSEDAQEWLKAYSQALVQRVQLVTAAKAEQAAPYSHSLSFEV